MQMCMYKVVLSLRNTYFFTGKDELTVLHASQCTPLASCSSVMDRDQDKSWMSTLLEWLRRCSRENCRIGLHLLIVRYTMYQGLSDK